MKFRFSKIIILLFFITIIGFFFASDALATTECKRVGCTITITIKIAFVGATAQQMQNWKNEIETVWNEPDTGKCECDVKFNVETKSVPSCQHADAQGQHCVEVTATLPKDSNNVERVAFMLGISQSGSSINGTWWTNTSRPIEGPFTIGNEPPYTPQPGENFKDAAHEAGHMMGLGDDYDPATGQYGNNIMGRTWGPNAKPTQAQIDQVVANNCKGEDAKCPAECCCGRNKKVDKDIQPPEECDPSATPPGCAEDETCTDKCKCIKKPPVCGDGKITPPEECDPAAQLTGCKTGEECLGCKCLQMEIPLGASISVAPNLLDFGAVSIKNSFAISNTGGETLAWQIIPDFPPAWLSVVPMTGEVLADQETTVWVNINRIGIVPGIYEHQLSITSNGGEGSVYVKMTVEEIF